MAQCCMLARVSLQGTDTFLGAPTIRGQYNLFTRDILDIEKLT